jgi:hypothetical protein
MGMIYRIEVLSRQVTRLEVFMSGSDPDREYKFLDVEALYEEDLEPVCMTAKQALEEALLDIIQLSEGEGVSEEDVDGVLRKIIDERASRTRKRFTIHVGKVDEAENASDDASSS